MTIGQSYTPYVMLVENVMLYVYPLNGCPPLVKQYIDAFSYVIDSRCCNFMFKALFWVFTNIDIIGL